MTTPEPGIYRVVAPDVYYSWKLMSSSATGAMLKSPAHGRHYLDHGIKETSSLKIGKVAHVAVLEPESFDERYSQLPKGAKLNTKAGKEAKAALLAERPDAEPLAFELVEQAWAMAEVLHEHPAAGALMKGDGANEVSFIWDHTFAGGVVEHAPVRCRGRVDRITRLDGMGVLVDYKTTKDASDWEFARSAARYGYHRQAAMYADAMESIDIMKGRQPLRRRYIFVVQETEAPYAVNVLELDEPSLREGRVQYQAALARFAQCVAADSWPSFGVSVAPIGLPSWAMTTKGM